MSMISDLLRGIIGVIRQIAVFTTSILFVFMICGVLVQVLGRYVFNYSIAGTEEAVRFAQVWMVMLGAGITMRYGKHVAIDLLSTLLPVRMARYLNVFIMLGCMWFLFICIKGALPLMQIGYYETSPAMGIPMWTMYICLIIGAVYLGIEVLMLLISRWDDPRSQKITES